MKCDTGKMYLKAESKTFLCDLRIADKVLSRARGLLMSRPLTSSEGMLIIPCNSVHTLGMKYKLDIVYLDKNGKVLKIVKNLPPLRLSFKFSAGSALELKSGEVERLGIEIGQRLAWEYN